MKTILFICSMGINRSKTAANMYSNLYFTKSVGVMDVRLEEIKFADKVFVFERRHKEKLKQKFNLSEQLMFKIYNLDIPDEYLFNSIELRELISEKVKGLL